MVRGRGSVCGGGYGAWWGVWVCVCHGEVHEVYLGIATVITHPPVVRS